MTGTLFNQNLTGANVSSTFKVKKNSYSKKQGSIAKNCLIFGFGRKFKVVSVSGGIFMHVRVPCDTIMRVKCSWRHTVGTFKKKVAKIVFLGKIAVN